MVDRRMQRKTKKRIVKEEVPCIVYLSSNEESSFELAEQRKIASSAISMIMQMLTD